MAPAPARSRLAVVTLTIPDFSRVRVLVAGDAMLDEYWFGDTARISPEAPVPVVRTRSAEQRAGRRRQRRAEHRRRSARRRCSRHRRRGRARQAAHAPARAARRALRARALADAADDAQAARARSQPATDSRGRGAVARARGARACGYVFAKLVKQRRRRHPLRLRQRHTEPRDRARRAVPRRASAGADRPERHGFQTLPRRLTR